MTGAEAVALLHESAHTGTEPGLSRMRELCGRLGNPERRLKFVHIAGTNGKGSAAAMLASVFSAAGLRAGLFTSPHLARFHERFQADGVPISDERLAALAARVLDAAAGLGCNEFELITALGFLFFEESRCELVALEVGLGGRLDPTNVIPPPEAAVIMNIGLEHTKLLGSTVERIAAEKCGIVKPGAPTILYGQSAAAESVAREACASRGASLTVTDAAALETLSSGLDGQTFRYRGRGPYRLSLLGAHQLRNAAVVLDTVEALRARGWRIAEAAAAQGLADARWPGRLELVRRSPDLLLDGAHNPQCAEALAEALRALYGGKKLVFLAGVLADKDYPAMFAPMLPLAERFVTVAPPGARALGAEELAAWLRGHGAAAEACRSAREGLARALALTAGGGAVCAFGSLYLIGELKEESL